MAVEEEGLRVFQSVKIKIGKKKIPYPQSERLNGYDSILTGQIGTEGWRLEGDRSDLSCSCCYCNSNHTLPLQGTDCKNKL